MTHLNDNDYILIQSFMRTKYGLTGNELLVYALVYTYSRAKGQTCKAIPNYFAEWLGTTMCEAWNILDKLCNEGLIKKREKRFNNVKYYEFVAVLPEELQGE